MEPKLTPEQNALNELRESFAQADAGQTVSLEEARIELRRRLGFSPTS